MRFRISRKVFHCGVDVVGPHAAGITGWSSLAQDNHCYNTLLLKPYHLTIAKIVLQFLNVNHILFINCILLVKN